MKTQLATSQSDTSQLDAEILLAYVLQKSRSYLFAWPEQTCTPAQHTAFQTLLTRRIQGESIAHILGEKEFWSLSLSVTKDTLIPRPDTELLVAVVLDAFPSSPPQYLADLGTGSGAIALALATERPDWHIVATDLCPAALDVARHNAKRLGLDHIAFYQGNWCAALPPQKMSILVSNPPYIAEGDSHLTDSTLSFEPLHALVSGKEGLDALHSLILQAPAHLLPDGWLFVEHGFDQAAAVAKKMKAVGYTHIQTHRDIGGNLRVTGGKYRG